MKGLGTPESKKLIERLQVQSQERGTHETSPVLKEATTGISFPLRSFVGVILNTLKIETTAIYMELLAKCLPGHILSYLFRDWNFKVDESLPSSESKTNRRIFLAWGKKAFRKELVRVWAVMCLVVKHVPVCKCQPKAADTIISSNTMRFLL